MTNRPMLYITKGELEERVASITCKQQEGRCSPEYINFMAELKFGLSYMANEHKENTRESRNHIKFLMDKLTFSLADAGVFLTPSEMNSAIKMYDVIERTHDRLCSSLGGNEDE